MPSHRTAVTFSKTAFTSACFRAHGFTVPRSHTAVLFSQSRSRSQWPCLSSCGMLGYVTRPGTTDVPSPRLALGSSENDSKERDDSHRIRCLLNTQLLGHQDQTTPPCLLFFYSPLLSWLSPPPVGWWSIFSLLIRSLPLSCFLDYTGFQWANSTALQLSDWNTGLEHTTCQEGGRDGGGPLSVVLCYKMEGAMHPWPLALLHFPFLIHDSFLLFLCTFSILLYFISHKAK